MAKLRVDKIAAPIIRDEFTGSVHFDGNGDRLSIADNTDFSFGTGDFTIECWAYSRKALTGTAYTLDYAHIAGKGSGVPDLTYALGFFQQKATLTSAVGGSYTNHKGATTLTNNTWYHLAVTRENGTLRIFVNGVLDYSTTLTIDFTNSKSFNIGDRESGDGHGQYPLDGYVSNLRVCKGHAVYTETFTPPTRELEVHTKPPKGVVFPAIDNVTTLLACQSSTDATADSSGRHTITAAGNATAADANPGLLRRTTSVGITTTTTGSVYFDGSGDYLDVKENDNDFDYDGDFTIETWIYFDTVPSATWVDFLGSSNNSVYLGSSKSGWIAAYYTLDATGLQFRLSYQNNSAWEFELGWNYTAAVDNWYHVVYTRENGRIYCYVNGVKLTRSSTVGTVGEHATITSSEGFLRIGGGYGTALRRLDGYLSNLRICKGHAVYKSADGNFTPPTTELDVHTQSVIVACQNGENIFEDKTGRHIIAAYGDRQSTPTQSLNNSPIGITTVTPGLIRNIDSTAGPTFQGGVGFVSQNWLTLPKGTTTDRNRCGGRGIFAGGGSTPNYKNAIEFITISSSGNAQDFGDLTQEKQSLGGTANSTRGIFASGYNTPVFPATGNNTDRIEYITIATTGDAVDFGNLDSAIRYASCAANSTRGLIAGGYTPTYIDRIEYITFATLGNAQTFGTLTAAGTATDKVGLSSPTRALFAGGENGSGNMNVIDYVTIASTGNGQDFGDLTVARRRAASASSGTRGLVAAGYNGSAYVNTIDYVTIASLGNAQDFGDTSLARSSSKGQVSSTIRGVFGSGKTPDLTNTIDYVTIASTGNANDFGDTIGADFEQAGCSDSHGGLG